jgi:hypothetical protein
MWLGSYDNLKVFFNERRGGMPTADNFGILRAVSVEIARTSSFPFFQSLNDTRPRMKHDGSKLEVQGVMRKSKEVSPHTYEMEATIEGNRLNLAYRLNVAAEEEIIHSKIWVWTKPFQAYAIDGETFRVGRGQKGYRTKSGGIWYLLEARPGQPKSITLLDSSGRLIISGSTIPPCFTEIYCYENKKIEVVYGWAKDQLQKGTYSGKLEIAYDR